MKQIFPSIVFFIAFTVLMFSCSTPIEPDFSFTPEMPRAGQVVKFTNLTETGESWNWTYGDGGTSTVKNPTYIYKKPGVYDITLRADSNDNYVITKKITIYDTIPSIYTNTDSVVYYEDITFSVLVYNPYGYAVTYNWEFSDNAVSELLTNGKSELASVKVFFKQRNVTETVKVKVQVGDSVYNIQKSFIIRDQKARSLLIAGSDGKVYRQRIFLRGLEGSQVTSYTAGPHPFTLQARTNYLYIFNAGSTLSTDVAQLQSKQGDGSIVRVNMMDNSVSELIHNRNTTAANGFYSGYVDANYIYWSDFSAFLYRHSLNAATPGAFDWKGSADAQTTVPYYLVKANRLGYFGNGLNDVAMNTGLFYYDFVYFWSKGGSGKGIFRFTANDILSSNVIGTGNPPSSGAILTDFAIRSFCIDPINQKIYFAATAPADKTGFWVANLSGSNPVRIDNAPVDDAARYITGIAIDHYSNKVYWAYRAPSGLSETYFTQNPTHRTGIKMVRLAKNYSVDTDVQYLAPGLSAYGITIDEVKK